MSPTTEEIRAKLDGITTLYAGSHSPDGQMCVMEATAFVAGEPWSDTPQCVSPVIAVFLRRWNDDLPDDATRTQLLKPLIPHVIGTKNGRASEIRRAWMATDWVVRSLAPIFLRVSPGLVQHAAALEALGEIVGAVSARRAQPTLAAAWVAAWAAAGAAIQGPITAAQASAADLVLHMCAVGRA